MIKIFNSSLEIGMRLLFVLYGFQPERLSISRIIYFDLITTYSAYFGLSQQNLHGDNPYGLKEIAARRRTFKRAIKSSVLDGLTQPNYSAKYGFLYSLTASGIKFIESIDSTYKNEYLNILTHVKEKYGRKNSSELVDIIRSHEMNAIPPVGG